MKIVPLADKLLVQRMEAENKTTGGIVLPESAKFRFGVRPGVTGYWRVGPGEDFPLEDLLAQDANYVRNWSLIQDLKLLIMSLGNILTGKKRNPELRYPD